MKKIFLYIVTIFILTAFISCSEDIVSTQPTPENNFMYPFEKETSWFYGTRNFITNIRIDSAENPFSTDSLTGYGDASFLRDTVIDQDTLRIFKNSHSEEGHAHSTYELYKQTDSGLIRFAYYSDGTNFGPFRPVENYRFSINSFSFNSLNEMFYYFYLENINYKTENSNIDTTLIFDNPPVTALKYPITEGMEWHFKTIGITKFTKKYLNYVNVESAGNNYYCIKLQKFWYLNNSQTPEANIIYYDYFSKQGMVKRDFTIKDIAVSNQLGKVIGYIDAKEESFLYLYIQP